MAKEISKQCKYHSMPNTFYCYTDKEGFCAECVEEEKHSQHKSISRAKLVKMLEEHYDRKRADIQRKIEATTEAHNHISASKQQCDTEIESIDSFYKAIEEKFQLAVRRHQERFTADTKSTKQEADTTLAQIKAERDGYDHEIKQLDNDKADIQTWKANSDLANLINRLEDIDSSEGKESAAPAASAAPQVSREVPARLPAAKEKEQFKQPDNVDKKILVFVDRFHGEGVENSSIQTGHGHIYSLSPFSPDVYYYDLQDKLGSKFEMVLPDGSLYEPPYNCASVECEGRLFISGGAANLESPLKTCVEFSRMSLRVLPRPEMLHERTEHAMVAHNKQLYVVSGRSTKEYTRSFERLSIVGLAHESAWNELAPVNVARAFLSVCVFTTGPSTSLFAFGGLVEDRISPVIEHISLAGDRDTWERISGIGEEKVLGHSAGAIQVGDAILLFGGSKGENTKTKDVYSYSPDRKKFTKDSDLFVEEQFYGLTNITSNGCVYAVGSCDIHVYHITTRKWALIAEQDWQAY